MRIRFGLHDVPHFCFSKTVVAGASHVVVGMNLDGKVFGRINELHQQWEVGPVFSVYGFSK